MKCSLTISSVWRVLTCVLVSLAMACCAMNPTLPNDTLPTADQEALLLAVRASADAWNRGDLKAHLAIYEETVTMMGKAGPRPGVAAIEQSFSQSYFVNGLPKQMLRMEQLSLRGLSERSALMTGRFVLSGGGLAEQSGWFTLIWVKTAAGWRAVHDHTS